MQSVGRRPGLGLALLAALAAALAAAPAEGRRGGGCARSLGCGPAAAIAPGGAGELAPLLDPGGSDEPAAEEEGGPVLPRLGAGGSRAACTAGRDGASLCR